MQLLDENNDCWEAFSFTCKKFISQGSVQALTETDLSKTKENKNAQVGDSGQATMRSYVLQDC